MPWTTADRAREWVRGVDLVVEPTALNQALGDAEVDLRGRLLIFIAKATVDLWTDTTDTPDQVQDWTARFAAAMYMSQVRGYYLKPEIPDNPAAILYANVKDEIQEAKYPASRIILCRAGDPVQVAGMAVRTPADRHVEDLPVSQGGFDDSD